MESNLIGQLIGRKLELAGKAVELLPECVRPTMVKVQRELLVCLKDELTSYLGEDTTVKRCKPVDGSLKKIELE